MAKRLRAMVVSLSVLTLCLGLAQWSLAKEVVLYSSNQPELLDMVAQGFEAKTGVKVSVVRMGTGEAMKRIQAEKDNPLGDVFWSGDVAVLENAKKNFMPYRSPEAAVLPKTAVEKDGLWTASNTHLMIIMVNTKLVPQGEAPRPGRTCSIPSGRARSSWPARTSPGRPTPRSTGSTSSTAGTA